MIPIGERCEECSKIHLIKSISELNTLSPSLRIKIYKSEHRVFRDGYFASLDMNGQTWEFYEPLTVWKISLSQGIEEPEKEKTTTEKLIEEYYEVEEEEDL